MRTALRVAVIYLVVCTAWIVFSDQALELVAPSMEAYQTLQTWKGLAFVVGSAFLIFGLVYREIARARQSEELYRGLVEQSLAGIYVVQDKRFLFVSKRFAEVFGYTPEEVRRFPTVEPLVAPEDRKKVLENLARREAGEVEALQYRFTGRTKSGEQVRVQVHGRRANWRGRPAVLGLMLDVTQQEHMEEQLRKAQELEALGRLTGAVAHDFNNFLGAILGSLELVEIQIDDEHPAFLEIRAAEDATRKAADLTRQLLTFSRQRVFEPRVTNLNDLIREMEPVLRRLGGPNVEMELDLARILPPVRIDPSRFEQVLANLVMNGVQAVDDRGRIVVRTLASPTTEEGGRGEEQRAGTPGEAPSVLLEVEDDGCGMDAETTENIFQPFFTTKEEGTGLGLSTVHGIVTQAGGAIEVESRPGEGTLLRIALPPSPDPPAPRAPSREEEEERRVARAETILVLDSDPAMRSVVGRALEKEGYRVLRAGEGPEALDLLERRRDEVRLLLTDLELSRGDGIDVARSAGALVPGLRVLFMSAHASEEVLESLDRDESLQVLEKPFSMGDLLRSVGRAMDASPRRDGGSSAPGPGNLPPSSGAS